jgi:hypothetical protein
MMDLDIEIFNQWLLGNYPNIKTLEYFQRRLRSATGDSFIDMASAEFCNTMLNNEKHQRALDDLDDLENEASQKMEECLREGKPDEYNKYMATDYKAAMLTNPLNAIQKGEHLKSILVKDEENIEYLKNCIAKITKVMISRKIHDNTSGNTESGADKPPEAGTGEMEETEFIEYIKASGRIEKDVSENGKYNLFGKVGDFVHWYILSNHEASERFSFLPGYMDKYLNHGCTTETLKRYVRTYKKTVPGQLETEKSMEILRKMHNPPKSGINPA